EYVTRVEKTVPPAPVDELGLPLIYFMLVDSTAIFDRAKQTLRLCVNAHIGDDADAAYDRAVAELEEMAALLGEPSQLTPAPFIASAAVKVPPGNFTQARFEAVVDECKEFIRSGDIIQV